MRRSQKVVAGSGGVVFLPYLNGERTPHLDPDLSGAFFGINLQTGREQLARAVMEGCRTAVRYKDFVAEPDPKRHEIYMEHYQLYKDIFVSCREDLHTAKLLGRKNKRAVFFLLFRTYCFVWTKKQYISKENEIRR